jgi:benzoyl-CoA reductase/2-hydroxyglutaryl-CoA dehydratase subunit BcrC/BadD/HgdB
MAEKSKTTAVHSAETVRKIRHFSRAMHDKANRAKEEGRPVAYCMGGCAYHEILDAMGVTSVYTEHYGGVCAAYRVAEPFLVRAEADGYSNNLCGYCRNIIGFDLIRQESGQMPPNAPDGGVPAPDMMLSCSAGCDLRYKWYQAMGRLWDIPCFSFDVMQVPPFDTDLAAFKPHVIRYQIEQFERLIEFLEKLLDKKMDWDRLAFLVNRGNESLWTWWSAYLLRKNKPTPMPSEDHFSAIVPAVFDLSSRDTLSFYRELYGELQYKVDHRKGVLDEEKYRLLWAGGLPPWHTMAIINYFESFGAVFVMEASDYGPWPFFDVPPTMTNPLEILAERTWQQRVEYWDDALSGGCGHSRVQRILNRIEEYDVDGLMMHMTRSCRYQSLGQIHFNNLVQKHVKIPIMFMESDIVDLRDYNEAETKMRVDSFMETVDAFKTRGGRQSVATQT